MRKRTLLGLVAPLCAVLLAGCASADGDGSVTATAKRADLATMVLPQKALGELGRDLALDRTESGWVHNRAAAKETLDRTDNGRTLARSGRLGGYEARYSLGTEVELFRDEATASAYLEKQVAEIAESRGRLHQGVKIAAAGRFDVDDVGDEAHGFTATLSSGDLSLVTTGVAFRRGRVVGSVDVLQALELESSGGDEASGR